MKTIKNVVEVIMISGILLIVAACSPKVTVTQSSTGVFMATVFSAKEKNAMKSLAMKAMSVCERQHKTASIIEAETTYNGLDENQKRVINLANAILPQSKTFNSYDLNSQKYKATLRFRCE